MSKKPDFDNTIKKVEGISNKVDIIMRNRLIIAIFLIVDGITFILNPDTTLAGMAQNIILIILFASLSVLIANLAAKVKDTKTILITLVIIILAAFFYFYPDLIAGYIQLLLSLFIIYDGASNIVSALHWNDKLSKYTNAITNKYHKIIKHKEETKEKKEQKAKFKEIDDNINTELENQKKKLINPLQKMVDKSSKSTALYVTTNSISVIFGIVLLVYPSASMTIWGIIFLYTGFSNLLISIKTMNLGKKLKQKKFKEILFDAEKTSAEKIDINKTDEQKPETKKQSTKKQNAKKPSK